MSILDVKREEINEATRNYYEQIKNGFDKFKKLNHYADKTQLDKITLLDVVQEWDDARTRYVDCYKHIDFKYKEVALLMCLIIKTKPIYFQLGNADPFHLEDEYWKRKYNAVNELFAFYLCSTMLGFDPENDVEPELKDSFIYMLYRFDVNAEHLFMTLEAVDMSYKQLILSNAVLSVCGQRRGKNRYFWHIW